MSLFEYDPEKVPDSVSNDQDTTSVGSNDLLRRRRWMAPSALLVMTVMLIAACAIAPLRKGPVNIGGIPDGVYAGSAGSWPNKAEVRVTMREGRMTHVELVRHWASWIGRKAELTIPLRIIEKQSADVDAVTGATNSSRVIMHAVYDALEQGVRKSLGPP